MPEGFGIVVHALVIIELVVEYVNAISSPIGIPPVPIMVTTLLEGLGKVVQLVPLGLFISVHVVVILEIPSRNLKRLWCYRLLGLGT